MSQSLITCPYCWQSISVEDPGSRNEPIELVTDCEVCCRPILVKVSWTEFDGEPVFDVEPES